MSAEALLELGEAEASATVAALTVDGYADRVTHNAITCTNLHSVEVASMVASLANARTAFVRDCARVQRHRSLWLDKQREELSAVETILMIAAAMCDWAGLDLTSVVEGVGLFLPLIGCDVLTRLSSWIGPPPDENGIREVIYCLETSSRLMTGNVTSVVSGPGVQWCEPGSSEAAVAHNTVSITCQDDTEDIVRGLLSSDFVVDVSVDGTAVLMQSPVLSDNLFSFSYSVDTGMMGKTAIIRVAVLHHLLPPVSVTVSSHTLVCCKPFPAPYIFFLLSCPCTALLVSNFSCFACLSRI